MGYLDKAPASRIIKAQQVAWSGTGTSVSTFFGPGIYQIRVISPVAGYILIDNSTSSLSTSNFAGGTYIAANTAAGDMFACTPGMNIQFSSSTTSSALVSVTEMA